MANDLVVTKINEENSTVNSDDVKRAAVEMKDFISKDVFLLLKNQFVPRKTLYIDDVKALKPRTYAMWCYVLVKYMSRNNYKSNYVLSRDKEDTRDCGYVPSNGFLTCFDPQDPACRAYKHDVIQFLLNIGFLKVVMDAWSYTSGIAKEYLNVVTDLDPEIYRIAKEYEKKRNEKKLTPRVRKFLKKVDARFDGRFMKGRFKLPCSLKQQEVEYVIDYLREKYNAYVDWDSLKETNKFSESMGLGDIRTGLSIRVKRYFTSSSYTEKELETKRNAYQECHKLRLELTHVKDDYGKVVKKKTIGELSEEERQLLHEATLKKNASYKTLRKRRTIWYKIVVYHRHTTTYCFTKKNVLKEHDEFIEHAKKALTNAKTFLNKSEKTLLDDYIRVYEPDKYEVACLDALNVVLSLEALLGRRKKERQWTIQDMSPLDLLKTFQDDVLELETRIKKRERVVELVVTPSGSLKEKSSLKHLGTSSEEKSCLDDESSRPSWVDARLDTRGLGLGPVSKENSSFFNRKIKLVTALAPAAQSSVAPPLELLFSRREKLNRVGIDYDESDPTKHLDISASVPSFIAASHGMTDVFEKGLNPREKTRIAFKKTFGRDPEKEAFKLACLQSSFEKSSASFISHARRKDRKLFLFFTEKELRFIYDVIWFHMTGRYDPRHPEAGSTDVFHFETTVMLRVLRDILKSGRKAVMVYDAIYGERLDEDEFRKSLARHAADVLKEKTK